MKNLNLERKENTMKGITLISLIITIIILLILASVSISLLINEGIIGKSAEAVFRTEIEQYNEELKLAITEDSLNNLGFRNTKFNVRRSSYNDENTFTNAMKTKIPSFDKKYANKLEIKEDQLNYIGEDEQERTWLAQVISLAGMLKISYVYEDGTEAAPTYQKVIADGSYEVVSPTIEGYEPDRSVVCGQIQGDTNITVTYLLPSQGLTYKGLDSSGNETDVEEDIVAYTVSGVAEGFTGESILIPAKHNGKDVTQIKNYAFRYNQTIKIAIIPRTIQKVGIYIFNNSNVEFIKTDVENYNQYNTAFSGAQKLKEVEFGENTKLIGSQTVQSQSVKKITILSNDVTGITETSFDTSYNLKEIVVNSDNTSYKTIDGVLYSKNGKTLVCYPAGKTNAEFIIPSEVEVIGYQSLRQNTSLNKLYIPSTVKNIKGYAFTGCINLEYVSLNAESIDDYYNFQGDTNLKRVDIGTNVKYLTQQIFKNCTNLQEINYLGTREQWNSISKNSSWMTNSSITKIICTDGTINL